MKVSTNTWRIAILTFLVWSKSWQMSKEILIKIDSLRHTGQSFRFFYHCAKQYAATRQQRGAKSSSTAVPWEQNKKLLQPQWAAAHAQKKKQQTTQQKPKAASYKVKRRQTLTYMTKSTYSRKSSMPGRPSSSSWEEGDFSLWVRRGGWTTECRSLSPGAFISTKTRATKK